MRSESGLIIHSEKVDNLLVEVVDEGDHRSLYFAGDVLQSRVSLTVPHELLLSYTRYLMTGLLACPNPQRILIIGVGAGALIRFLHHHFPECHIDAVDNSDRIIEIAVGYFHLTTKYPVSIYCCDGFDYLSKKTQAPPYDLIFVDAFDDKGMAKSIYSSEFFGLCKEALVPRGCLCCNLWSGKAEDLIEVRQGLRQQFAGHLYIPVKNRGNIVVLAFAAFIPWQRILRSANELESLSKRFRIEFKEIIKRVKKHNMPLLQRLGLLIG